MITQDLFESAMQLLIRVLPIIMVWIIPRAINIGLRYWSDFQASQPDQIVHMITSAANFGWTVAEQLYNSNQIEAEQRLERACQSATDFLNTAGYDIPANVIQDAIEEMVLVMKREVNIAISG